jgi:Subtilase family/PA domain
MSRRWWALGFPGVAMAALLALQTPAFTQGRGSQFRATPLEPESQQSVTLRKLAVPGSEIVSVLVKLDDPSVAAYQGGIAGLAPTSTRVTGARRLDVRSAAARAYESFLDRKFQSFEESCRRAVPSAQVTHRLPLVFGGVAVVVPEDQVDAIRRLPGVRAVYADALLAPDTARSPQFIGARTIWRELGGQDSAGEGVVVGLLDTGIWPELPSFSDPDPFGKPYPPPPATWTGTHCDFSGGANPGPAFTCNNKLIGAQRFMSTYDAVAGLLPTEFTSARDDDGHGSHTSSTAAGNAGALATLTGVPLHEVSGVAPRAHVVMYKVCGHDGCYTSDSVAAINEAIADGVDVLNFSISGGRDPYSDAVSLAFLDAYAAGVFVAASAGNAGPAADTVDHREPWTTTVAASTDDAVFKGSLSLSGDGGASLELEGASVTGAVSSPAPVVSAADFGDALCLNPFPPATFSGDIVVCQRGTNARTDKSKNVAAGGAVGLILSNVSPTDTINQDNHFLPAIHLTAASGAALDAFLAAHTDVTATFTQGELTSVYHFPGGPPSLFPGTTGGADVMASFSSRGGPGQTLGISKPDVSAPGVQILAGRTLMPAAADSSATGAPGLYMFISGTSMASPHVAGAAALLTALHPDWSPWQIKSALMTTAWTRVTKEDAATPADAFDYGSGRIDLRRAGRPGLTFKAPAKQEFLDHQDDLWDLNYPSLYVPAHPGRTTVQRTLHSELDWPSVWFTDVFAPRDVRVIVPRFVYVPAHGDRTIDVTVDARDVPLGEVRFARLRFRHRDTAADFPVTLVRAQPLASLEKSCAPTVLKVGDTTDCTISFTNTTFEPQEVRVWDRLPRPLLLSGPVSGGTAKDGRFVSFAGTLGAAEPPGVTVSPGASPAGYLPLSMFAVPPISGVGDETITNFTVPTFQYAGESYGRVGLVSDGYLVVGGGTGADVQYVNQSLPDPTPPNNVLAPFWTDLNPAAGGAMRIATLTDSVNTWLVCDWEAVPNYSNPSQGNSFQVWIGLNGVEDVSYTYGAPLTGGEGGHLTVGAENRFGNRGDNYYYDGTGTLPTDTTELVVTSTPGAPGETRTIQFKARAVDDGDWENCAAMTGGFFGTSLSCVQGEVQKKHHHRGGGDHGGDGRGDRRHR